jgi:2-polyprenyl-3-methyl-5-hydroxy-6-metoxy-1,4-benzoquinol methylase
MNMNAFDQKKADEFVGRVLSDTAAVTTTALSSIGDRLGIWRDLAEHGPATPVDLARRMGLSERHLREWCAAMASAGYLELCTDSRRYGLPAEHVPVLARENGPVFFGGVQQCVLGYLGPLERIIETFRTGGGVPQSAYAESTYDGMERFTASWFENLLVPVWLPAVGADRRLASGIEVADVGCGRGRALIKLAQTYPHSRFVGYDVYGPNVARAREHAERAGVAQRVTFEQLDVAHGLPRAFDLVTTFDVLHDAVDPISLLRSIKRGLRKDGSYLCLDINCSEHVEKNAGTLGAFFYGCSVLYCMSTSLAHGGAALGTCGLHEPKLRALADDAGFSRVERVALENPFNTLYELRAE